MTQIRGSWDPVTTQQAAADILAAYLRIDGVVVKDREYLAAIRAFEAAGRDIPIINDEGFRPFIEYWTANPDKGFTSYAIANGPGFAMTTVLGVGLRMLMGSTFKEEFLPAGEKISNFDHRFEITDKNVVQALEDHTKYRGLEDYIDEVWKMKDANALFNESEDLDAMLQ
ncbi:MAG: hypothetical protein NTV16_00950 [Actinobacteria bacterium]|nr:hypothetical protein [Actinomycetota bacterium]